MMLIYFFDGVPEDLYPLVLIFLTIFFPFLEIHVFGDVSCYFSEGSLRDDTLLRSVLGLFGLLELLPLFLYVKFLFFYVFLFLNQTYLQLIHVI